MATIVLKELIEKLIQNNGEYEGDPPVDKIVEYTTVSGTTVWGVVWSHEHESRKNRYDIETEYIKKPKIIFERKEKVNG